MTAQARLADFKPFNSLAAYEEARERVRMLQGHLETTLGLLEMECGRRELRGEDTAYVRAAVSRVRREAFQC
jgi:hypothetical protein